ncbi:MAG: MoxR family ATPase [Actinomycetota bacterium]|nr:MoxR family ATPase [Actinomycetota bacterium]
MEKDHEVEIILEGQYKAAYEVLEDAVSVGLTPIIIGPPGVGKSLLVRKFAIDTQRMFDEVFFDELMRPGYLIGSFDPAFVLQKGYCRDAFENGPLLRAMMEGGVFLAQEINRASEFCQNSLLEPLEERSYYIPRIGRLNAHEKFILIATANPAELAGTHRISEALRDRLRVWIPLTYPDMETELKIITLNCGQALLDGSLLEKIYSIVKAVRENPDLEIPVSIRAGISMAKLISRHISQGREMSDEVLVNYASHVLLGSSHETEWIVTRNMIKEISSGALAQY